MIHLTTGSPGSGKTLFTLSWVHKLWEETGRPVCYTDKLELLGEAENWGWKQIDIQNWEQEPDGTIFLVDEAQFPFRKSASTSAPPPWIENLTVHRHRGFDFFLITQNPKYLHLYLRDLIAAPGWHRHIKRKGTAPIAAVLEWETFYADASDLTSGTTAASLTHQALPKEFYDKYRSASIHTAKFKLPRAFWLMVLGFLAAAGLFWFAFYWLSAGGTRSGAASATDAALVESAAAAAVASGQGLRLPGSSPPDDYLTARAPRVPGLPHTAPIYDEVTKPVRAPIPAACLEMGGRCQCYTQQGTRMGTPDDLCRQIVKTGFFVDWDTSRDERRSARHERGDAAQPGATATERSEGAGRGPRFISLTSQDTPR